MATLSSKHFPDKLYQQLKTRVVANHRSVAQEVTHILTQAQPAPKLRSILELEGLGKEIWEGIDAASYVKEERDS